MQSPRDCYAQWLRGAGIEEDGPTLLAESVLKGKEKINPKRKAQAENETAIATQKC
jgi:hypothetical protein